jgi:hypothetical protein
MRVFAALLAMLASGSAAAAAGEVAVTMDAHPARVHGCTVTTGATIVAYDANGARDVLYRFVRSDGTVSRTGRVAFGGADGAVAQTVTDTWTPRGASPWIALEIVAPGRLRSARLAVASPCAHRTVAATK